MERLNADTASSWPMMRLCSSLSMVMSFLDSAWVSLNTGMPVVWEITSAMTSSSTTIFTPRRFLLLAFGFQLLLLITQLSGLFEVLALDGLVLLFGKLGDLRVKFLKLRRSGQTTDAQTRTGLIDQIDGLVWQMTVLNVTAPRPATHHR